MTHDIHSDIHNTHSKEKSLLGFYVKGIVLNLVLLLASIAVGYLFCFAVVNIYGDVLTFEKAIGSTLVSTGPVFCLLREKIKR